MLQKFEEAGYGNSVFRRKSLDRADKIFSRHTQLNISSTTRYFVCRDELLLSSASTFAAAAGDFVLPIRISSLVTPGP